jgi:hypothetical protein
MAGWHHNLSGMNGENMEKRVPCLGEDSNSEFSVCERKIKSTDYAKKFTSVVVSSGSRYVVEL